MPQTVAQVPYSHRGTQKIFMDPNKESRLEHDCVNKQLLVHFRMERRTFRLLCVKLQSLPC